MKGLSQSKIEGFNQYYDWWIQILKNEINSVWSIMVFYVGKWGSGKSYSAIKDALSLDPNFSIDQILFKKEEVVDFIDEHSYSGGHVGVWDEFGAEMHAREWFEREQKKLIQLLQTIRETDLTFMVCLPHLIFGDSSVDALANFCAELYKPKHKDDPYRVAKALEMDGLYSKRKRMEFRPIWFEGQIFHVPYINPRKKNKLLFKEYHKKKTQYVKWRIAENKKQHEEDGLTGVQVRYLKEFIEGRSYTQIADKFKVSEQAVKEMKRKLRRKGVLN